ncbi:MAG: type II toxin-antitoxin system RelE/ParE family toxin [Azonexus sp.]|nr:type II toxin-antitoxin system RelE/ParE family toxin [Azonexus sp.]MDP3637146.1 type II toxin-antitoxin system RelE/ParE family toxin [Azonexus sp.]MDZ4313645.1 type II toxin-antitoxin system RelE/ParE family toxin [Azonexus sp.]
MDMHTFIELPSFTRHAEDYFSDGELAELQIHLSKNAKAGDVVPGSGGVRKLRWARAGMGKRGGVRVLYYVQDSKGRIWLLTVYAKSAQENIPVATLNLLREFADHAEIE